MSLKTVASFTDALQAHIAKGKLESEGIHATLAHEHHVWANWMISNAIGGVKIQVPQAEEEKAKGILSDLEAGRFQIESDECYECPKCNSKDIIENKNSWRLAFLGLFFLHIPIPYRRNRVTCNSCRNKWKMEDYDN
ncbi:MAG: DUF2007 domain-containing protein [Gammaproteobacteria bacterium]|nr:DUF2007 domain-containing protein [Gammaproteobacteria bacterium]